MMSILRKKNLHFSSSSSSSSFRCFLTRNATLLHLSSSSTKNPSPKSNLVTEYLISSCGLTLEKATTASKYISHVNFPDRPNSVRHFLKHQGFTDAHIRTIISRFPHILCVDADRTIGPNLIAIRDLGFPEHELQKFILFNPRALFRSAISRLEFWRNFLGGDSKKLFLACTRNLGLINLDIDKKVLPAIALLKNYGLSDADIGTLVLRGQGLIWKRHSSMELLLKTVQELGFPTGSPMFVFSLSCFSGLAPATLKAKMEIYKSFGWSQEELVSALLKCPLILRFSEETIQSKMEFLVEIAGCTHKYIAGRPTILGYSLEKRLIPRHRAMEILKSKELIKRDLSLYSAVCFPEKKFLEKIILPYKDEVPMLLETYLADSGGENQLCWINRTIS